MKRNFYLFLVLDTFKSFVCGCVCTNTCDTFLELGQVRLAVIQFPCTIPVLAEDSTCIPALPLELFHQEWVLTVFILLRVHQAHNPIQTLK
jgi:hypothetical protein